jgi:hypothetical protein
MYKTEITYKDFLDNNVTETLRFNISEDELLDLVREDERFDSGYLAYVVEQQDYPKMMDIVRKLIILSYGELSDDGRYFRKSDEKALDFLQSAAYPAFRDYLLEGKDGQFEAFLMGVFPSKFAAVVKERLANPNGDIKQQLSVLNNK